MDINAKLASIDEKISSIERHTLTKFGFAIYGSAVIVALCTIYAFVSTLQFGPVNQKLDALIVSVGSLGDRVNQSEKTIIEIQGDTRRNREDLQALKTGAQERSQD